MGRYRYEGNKKDPGSRVCAFPGLASSRVTTLCADPVTGYGATLRRVRSFDNESSGEPGHVSIRGRLPANGGFIRGLGPFGADRLDRVKPPLPRSIARESSGPDRHDPKPFTTRAVVLLLVFGFGVPALVYAVLFVLRVMMWGAAL